VKVDEDYTHVQAYNAKHKFREDSNMLQKEQGHTLRFGGMLRHHQNLVECQSNVSIVSVLTQCSASIVSVFLASVSIVLV
jgi:hypothetical protein